MTERQFMRLVLESALTVATFSLFLELALGVVPPWWVLIPGQTLAVFIVFFLIARRRHGLGIRVPQRPTFTPNMIDHPDELGRHVMAQSWNTGKPVVGWYDEDGKMHFREQELPRVPITVTDKDGNVTDGTAAAFMTIVEDKDGARHISGRLGDVRDLDGNVLSIPSGGRLNGSIEA